MITFAAIAASGDVNVNSIAPGIAAALAATVAGLVVAIPALFGYNYLAGQSDQGNCGRRPGVYRRVFDAASPRSYTAREAVEKWQRKFQEENELYDEINVVPMLDLAYVLLVIFIILTTATVQGISVNLPKASRGAKSGGTAYQG